MARACVPAGVKVTRPRSTQWRFTGSSWRWRLRFQGRATLLTLSRKAETSNHEIRVSCTILNLKPRQGSLAVPLPRSAGMSARWQGGPGFSIRESVDSVRVTALHSDPYGNIVICPAVWRFNGSARPVPLSSESYRSSSWSLGPRYKSM